MGLIVLLYLFSCKPKIVTPSITGNQVQHSYLAQATKNTDRVIRGRAFQLLLRGAGPEEWKHWWPRLVADQTTGLQLEVLQSILPAKPPAALLLVVELLVVEGSKAALPVVATIVLRSFD